MPKRRVLVLTVAGYEPPDSLDGMADKDIHPIKTDFDVVATLKDLGHTVQVLGLEDSLAPLRETAESFKPHVVFNLLELFDRRTALVPYVLGYLELMNLPYTGCNPVGMIFSNNKERQRKILRHHRIPVPAFFTVKRGAATRRPTKINFPLIVKSLTEHGSAGIAEASVVHSDDKLAQRVQYIHDTIKTDAIVEQYIHGREVYLGIIGNHRLTTFPLWEIKFAKLREGAPLIATERIKWNVKRQDSTGVDIGPADLPEQLKQRIANTCKRAYRALEQNGYARFDLRVTDDHRFYLIESNPNPQLAFDEEFAESAAAANLDYPTLLTRIINLATNAAKSRTPANN